MSKLICVNSFQICCIGSCASHNELQCFMFEYAKRRVDDDKILVFEWSIVPVADTYQKRTQDFYSELLKVQRKTVCFKLVSYCWLVLLRMHWLILIDDLCWVGWVQKTLFEAPRSSASITVWDIWLSESWIYPCKIPKNYINVERIKNKQAYSRLITVSRVLKRLWHCLLKWVDLEGEKALLSNAN